MSSVCWVSGDLALQLDDLTAYALEMLLAEARIYGVRVVIIIALGEDSEGGVCGVDAKTAACRRLWHEFQAFSHDDEFPQGMDLVKPTNYRVVWGVIRWFDE